MFNHIGKKIKVFAKALFWMTVIIFVIGAIIVFSIGTQNKPDSTSIFIIIGIIMIVLGIAIAWLNNFLLYGFGELIDSNQKILEILEKEKNNVD